MNWLLGDRGYDADWFREALKDKGIRACIPGRKQRKTPVESNERRYKRRNRIESMFGRLRDWRRVATRYDRCPKVILSAIALIANLIYWLRVLTLGRFAIVAIAQITCVGDIFSVQVQRRRSGHSFMRSIARGASRVRRLYTAGKGWWVMRDSNSRHLRCKRSALPTELITRDAAFSQACGQVQEGLEDFLAFPLRRPFNGASCQP